MVDCQLEVYIYIYLLCVYVYSSCTTRVLVYTLKRAIFKFLEYSFVYIIENAINMRTWEFNNNNLLVLLIVRVYNNNNNIRIPFVYFVR